MSDRQAIEDRFPKLPRDGYRQTSRGTDVYNCVAWVARNVREWLSPEDVDGFVWPRDELGDGTGLDRYERFFELHGFRSCEDGSLEDGFEKIAVYGDGDEFDHVAFQRVDGKWSSKLGELGDIQHDHLASLEDNPVVGYLPARRFMKRPREPHPLADRGLLLPGDDGF